MQDSKQQVLTELLVIQAQEGDPTAFRDLFDLWNANLLRLAASRLGNHQAAQDVTQETWIQVAARIRSLRDPACFPKWLFQILFRRCADHQRKACRTRTVKTTPVDAAILEAIPAPVAGDSPATFRLQEAITGLPPAARELLQLYYGASLSLSNIAELLKLPVGTVKSRLFHLREELKTIIQNTEI
jgi:RNA polymerase sigma-70 factor (ECF subfamily)